MASFECCSSLFSNLSFLDLCYFAHYLNLLGLGIVLLNNLCLAYSADLRVARVLLHNLFIKKSINEGLHCGETFFKAEVF